jgi:hypothetical protein
MTFTKGEGSSDSALKPLRLLPLRVSKKLPDHRQGRTFAAGFGAAFGGGAHLKKSFLLGTLKRHLIFGVKWLLLVYAPCKLDFIQTRNAAFSRIHRKATPNPVGSIQGRSSKASYIDVDR